MMTFNTIKKIGSTALLFVMFLSTAGCYHATVTTGLTPSAQVIDQPFATGWIFGLVPPSTVDAASQCPSGVAMVETQLSFVNQLVSSITFGIYTPMHITVTCAASGATGSLLPEEGLTVPNGHSTVDVQETFEIAADRAVTTGEPVFVHFE